MELKELIKRAEERYVWADQELQRLYRMGLGKSDPGWIKDLKDTRNWDEAWLKTLREEQTHLNQGLNPPFCYPRKKS